MLTYDEKRSLVSNALIDAMKFRVGDEHAFINEKTAQLDQIPVNEIHQLIKQLEQESAINVLSSKIDTDHFRFEILVLNEDYLQKQIPFTMSDLDKMFAPLKTSGSKDPLPMKVNSAVSDSSFFIVFNDDRRILLNGKIELAKPDFEGTNELIFSLLYKNPYETFTKDQLEETLKIKIEQNFDKIVENLGFRRGLKSAFFDIKSDSIRFKNPVTL